MAANASKSGSVGIERSLIEPIAFLGRNFTCPKTLLKSGVIRQSPSCGRGRRAAKRRAG